MQLLFNGNEDMLGLMIAGRPEDLRRLGARLIEFDSQLKTSFSAVPSKYYKYSLSSARFSKSSPEEALLSLRVSGDGLNVTGGHQAFSNLGHSLVDFFAPPVGEGEHFQLDHFDETIVSAETPCMLVCSATFE